MDESTVGGTPVVELPLDVPPTVYAKLEWFNLYDQPYGGGSVKTRIARAMLDDAAAAGELDDDPTIVEPSSGNTGAALARIGGARGYDVEIYTPPRPSETKVLAIEDAGGSVVRSETYERMRRDCATRVETAPEPSYRPNQYENPANPRVHEEETGAEIREQVEGLTHFVAGVGTGGTITGVGRALPDAVEVLGYEPERPSHSISGLRYARGVTFEYPGVFDQSVPDVRRTVTSAAARRWARRIRQRAADETLRIHDAGQHDEATVREHLRVDDQFLVGPSSGGTLAALAAHAMDGNFGEDDAVVVLFADRGDRYMRFPEWASEWVPPT